MKNKLKAALFAAALIAGYHALADATWTDENGYAWTYTVSSGKAVLQAVSQSDGTKPTGHLDIPDSVNGYAVESIGYKAFQNLEISSLRIADSVRSIDRGAFYNCSSLETVDLGNGLTTIEDGTDSYLTPPSTNDGNGWKSTGAFSCCYNLKSITFGSNLQHIGNHAFSESQSLTNLVFSESVQHIGNGCFYHAISLMSVRFGSNVKTIGNGAFAACTKLQTATFANSTTAQLSIGRCAFGYDTSLSSLSFSGSLAYIGQYAFEGCGSIISLVFPDTLKTLGNGAFYNCSALETVDLGNGLTTIEDGTDYYLTPPSTNDGNGWKSTGAFSCCYNLKSITFGSNLQHIGNHAFSESQSLTDIVFPESLQYIGRSCFFHATSLKSVNFGTKLETIAESAFAVCTSLKSVVFAECDSPRLEIKNYAFGCDSSLSSVQFSGSLQYLSAYAFFNCPLMRNLVFPSSLFKVERNAFSLMGGVKAATFFGLPPTGLSSSGLELDTIIRYSTDWAEAWEEAVAECGYTDAAVYDSGETGGSGSTGGGTVASGAVSLTVTNVVLHYVTQSVPGYAVIPPTTAGIVNVMTEVNAGRAIAISADWAAQYPGFGAKFGSDLGVAVVAETGKRDGTGNAMRVWQDFVAGTDPTDPDDVFTASITFDAETEEPVISWSPELTEAEAAKRIYRTYGKVRLTDAEWTEVSEGDEADYNFFKVSVEMR